MMRIILTSAIVMMAASLCGVVGPAASAQLSADGGPIRIRAESSEVLEKERRVIFLKDVDIIQGDARLATDKLIINYSGKGGTESGLGAGFGEIKDLVAEGNVFYVTPEIKAKGDRGIYTEATRTIVLTGDVALKRGQDVARGCKMTLRLDDSRSQLSGCETTGVVMVINPTTER